MSNIANATGSFDEVYNVFYSLRPCGHWAVIWLICNWFVLPSICRRVSIISKWYCEQSSDVQIQFSAIVIACIHGALAASTSTYAVFNSSLTYEDVKSHSKILEHQYYITAGYFISDTIQMLRQGDGTNRKQFILHHCVCFMAMALSLRTGCCYYFIALKMMMEISTPFMNIGLLLQLLDLTNDFLYILNGHIFYWTFVISRPLMIPQFWYQVFMGNTFEILSTIPRLYTIFWICLTIGLDVLNIVWAYNISKDYIKKVKEIHFSKEIKED